MEPIVEQAANGTVRSVDEQQSKGVDNNTEFLSQDAQNVLDDLVLGFQAPFTQSPATKPVVPQQVQTQLKGVRRTPVNKKQQQQQPTSGVHEISSDDEESQFFRSTPVKRPAATTSSASAQKRVPIATGNASTKAKAAAARQPSASSIGQSRASVDNGTANRQQRQVVLTVTTVERTDNTIWQKRCADVSNFLRPGCGDLELMKFMSITFRTDKERENDLTQTWPVSIASLILLIFAELKTAEMWSPLLEPTTLRQWATETPTHAGYAKVKTLWEAVETLDGTTTVWKAFTDFVIIFRQMEWMKPEKWLVDSIVSIEIPDSSDVIVPPSAAALKEVVAELEQLCAVTNDSFVVPGRRTRRSGGRFRSRNSKNVI